MQAELEEKLIHTISYWCYKITHRSPWYVWHRETEEVAESSNPFLPVQEELEQTVWTKLLAPDVTSKLERMWERERFEVDRFVLKVVKRALIDFKRRQDVRKSEVLALPLDFPVYATNSGDAVVEDTGDTLGDFIWDEPRHDMWGGPTMWAFEPEAITTVDSLKVLSPEEREIWKQVALDGLRFNSKDPGENVRAIYSRGKHIGQSVSKTQANLMFRRAKAVAEPVLRKSFGNWHAILTPYIYRIDKTACGGSTCSRQTVRLWRFINRESAPNLKDREVRRACTSENPDRPYDPAPPKVKPTKRARAKRECINPACTYGLAIDKHNLILPANWRHVPELKDKPVRYLPATTKKSNTFCNGCKTAITAAGNHIVPTTADFSADFSLSPQKSETAEKDFSCLNIATQQSEPLTLGA